MKKSILLFVLGTICISNALSQAKLEFRVLQNKRLDCSEDQKLAVLSDDFEFGADVKLYSRNFGQDIPSEKILPIFAIAGQSYRADGIFLKIRFRDEKDEVSKIGLWEALNGKTISFKKNPTADDYNDRANKFKVVHIEGGDYAVTLDDGYIFIPDEDLPPLENNDILVMLLEDKPDSSGKTKIIANIAVQEYKDSTHFEEFDLARQFHIFPLLTFSNISAIAKNESNTMATPLLGLTLGFSFFRLHFADTDINFGLTIFGSLDGIRLLSLRGQQITEEEMDYFNGPFARSISFGLLTNWEVNDVAYFIGFGMNCREGWGQVNPLKPSDSEYDPDMRVWEFPFDFGVIIGVELLDVLPKFIESLMKGPEK